MTGYIFYFAGGPLHWKSQKHSFVALSTVESEYLAPSKADQQCVYLRHLMSTIVCKQKDPTILYEDNEVAVRIAYNSGYHPRTKHIGLKYHYGRHLIKEKTVVVQYISTLQRKADILSKSLGPLKYLNKPWRCRRKESVDM